jgi:hypothetical protein
MASLKDLDQRLFENYIELKADPIVGSLEPGIYAGYFDWKDCLPPTGKFLKVLEFSVHALVKLELQVWIWPYQLKDFSLYSHFSHTY